MDRKAKSSVETESTAWLGVGPKSDSGEQETKFHVKPVLCSPFEAKVQILAVPTPEMKLKENR